MMTDYHTHVLPGIDDGARNPQISEAMLQCLQEQGVHRVVFTPHFYAHRERSVARFLEKRQQAFAAMSGIETPLEMQLGAEVALESGLADLEGIEQLAISGTSLILLEPSYYGFQKSTLEMVHNIAAEHNLRPVIAHLHRYVSFYSKSELEQFLKLNAVFQVNMDAFSNWKERQFVKELLKREKEIVFGSDCHNLDTRKPEWDVLQKKLKDTEKHLAASDAIFERYRTSKA